MQGTLYIVSAPSGAGKSSLVQALVQRKMLENIHISISHTTRPKRAGECDDEHYFFVTKSAFQAMVAENAFLEYALIFDNYYGTASANIISAINNNHDLLLEIDWQGAKQIQASHKIPNSCICSIFILPPSRYELEQRLRRRAQDSDAVIAKRMAQAIEEIRHYEEYDHLIINDNFEYALEQLTTIIACDRLKTKRQKYHHNQLIKSLLTP